MTLLVLMCRKTLIQSINQSTKSRTCLLCTETSCSRNHAHRVIIYGAHDVYSKTISAIAYLSHSNTNEQPNWNLKAPLQHITYILTNSFKFKGEQNVHGHSQIGWQ